MRRLAGWPLKPTCAGSTTGESSAAKSNRDGNAAEVEAIDSASIECDE